jgi:hypothetical protein
LTHELREYRAGISSLLHNLQFMALLICCLVVVACGGREIIAVDLRQEVRWRTKKGDIKSSKAVITARQRLI